MSEKIYMNYIDGSWVSGKGKASFKSINPANWDDVLGYFPASMPEDVDSAIESARAAQELWVRVTPIERAQVLSRVASIIRERESDLAKEMTREVGKTLRESTGEVRKAADTFEFHASQGRMIGGRTIPSTQNATHVYTLRVPLGVVGVITPWNVPLAIPARKLAPALLTGNTVVFKPSSLTPKMAVQLTRILEEARMPHGTVNLVTGSGSQIGNYLVSHAGIDGVSFTGSTETGLAINKLAAPRLTKVQLELGGKNALIVLPDADLDQAVTLAIKGACSLSGQLCTATSRVIAHNDIHDELVSKLEARLSLMKIGNGLDPDTDMGPLADEKQLSRVLNYIAIGKDEGAILKFGGRHLTNNGQDRGYFVEPALFTEVYPEMKIAQEEIFGPVISLLKAESLDHAIEISNSVSYGLSGALCTRDIANVYRFVEASQTGFVGINVSTSGVEVQVPFGGMKNSGSSYREQGWEVLHFYTEVKSVAIKYL